MYPWDVFPGMEPPPGWTRNRRGDWEYTTPQPPAANEKPVKSGPLVAWLRFLVDGLAKERDAARREADRWREEAERSRRSEAEALADAAQARAELTAYLGARAATAGAVPPSPAPPRARPAPSPPAPPAPRPRPVPAPPPTARKPARAAPWEAAVLRTVERAVEVSLALTPDDLRLRKLAAQQGGVDSLERLVTGAARLLKITGVENAAGEAHAALRGPRKAPPLAAKDGRHGA